MFGFYPFKNGKTLHWNMFKRVFFFTSFVILIGQMFLIVFYMDSGDLLAPFMIWVTEFGFVCKLLLFFYNGQEILMLEDELNEPAFSNIPRKCLETLERDVKFTKWLTNIYRFVIISFATYVAFLKPFLNSKVKRELPFEVLVPCNLENNFCYVSFFIFQAIVGYISSQTNINMECLFCKLMTACGCLFDVLHYNLTYIDYSEEMAEEDLRYNILLHQKLVR